MDKKESWLVGNYEIGRHLGTGEYSQVYQAKNRISGKSAAVKIFNASCSKNVNELFNREAVNMTKSEGHENIIRFLECSRPGESHFIVMELKKGNLRTYPPSHLFAILNVVKQIASALQHAHKKGIIHLDVKPENILVDDSGKPFLSDFGISRKLDVLTGSAEPNTTKGSYHYMAPECARDKHCPASDQYSLAVTLYELLCKTKPFEGKTAQELEQQRPEMPPSIHEHRKNLPRNTNSLLQQRLDKVLQRALQKNPEDRYESVEAFAKALEDAIRNPLGVRHNTTRRTMLGVAALSGLALISAAIANVISAWVNPAPQLSLVRSARTTQTSYSGVSTPNIPTSGFGSLVIAPYQAKAETTIAALSPNKQYIASGTINGDVDVWKISNNPRAQSVHKQKKATQDIAWLDNRSIVSTSNMQILAWDAFTKRPISQCPPYSNKDGYDLNTRWSPDPQKTHVALYMGSKVIIFDRPLPGRGWNNHDVIYTAHTDVVNDVAWSPDGALLASASDDTTVQTWNVETGTLMLKYTGHHCSVDAVAYSPNAQYIASAGEDGQIHIYYAQTGTPLIEPYFHEDDQQERSVSVTSLAWSPDSLLLASSGDNGRVRVFNTQTLQYLDYTGHKGGVNQVSWLAHPHGLCIVSCSADTTVHVWRATQQL